MSNSRIEQLKIFLNDNSKDSFVLYALATEYINLGDDETALYYFNQLLEDDPDYTGAYYHLGKLYQRRDDPIKAEEIFNEGIKRTQAKDLHANRELREALSQLYNEENEE